MSTGQGVAVWIICGIIGMIIAKWRGFPLFKAFICGAILGFAAPLMVFAKPEIKKCPHCAEKIKYEAKVCPKCQRDQV